MPLLINIEHVSHGQWLAMFASRRTAAERKRVPQLLRTASIEAAAALSGVRAHPLLAGWGHNFDGFAFVVLIVAFAGLAFAFYGFHLFSITLACTQVVLHLATAQIVALCVLLPIRF